MRCVSAARRIIDCLQAFALNLARMTSAPSQTSAIPWLLTVQQISGDFRVGRDVLADLLEQLANFFDISVKREKSVSRCPIAAEFWILPTLNPIISGPDIDADRDQDREQSECQNA